MSKSALLQCLKAIKMSKYDYRIHSISHDSISHDIDNVSILSYFRYFLFNNISISILSLSTDIELEVSIPRRSRNITSSHAVTIMASDWTTYMAVGCAVPTHPGQMRQDCLCLCSRRTGFKQFLNDGLVCHCAEVAEVSVVPSHLPEDPPQDLSGPGLGQGPREMDVIR